MSYQERKLDEPPLRTCYDENPSLGDDGSNHTDCTTDSSNSRSTCNMADAALILYFKNLAMEMKVDRLSEHMNIIVDNAHIPLRICRDEGRGMEDDTFYSEMEGMSRSLSAIHTVSFPPPFLKGTASLFADGASRWESMKSAFSSDICLSVPHRSWESPSARSPIPPATAARGGLSTTLSMDSSAKMLRELPLESYCSCSPRRQPHFRGRHTTSARNNIQDGISYPPRQEDLPTLEGYPFDKMEPHPHEGRLRRISEGSLECKFSFDEDDNDDIDEGETKSRTTSSFCEDEPYYHGDTKKDGGSPTQMALVAFDRWDSSPSTCFKYVSSPFSTPTNEGMVWSTVTSKSYMLCNSISPRASYEFPLMSSPLSSSPAAKCHST